LKGGEAGMWDPLNTLWGLFAYVLAPWALLALAAYFLWATVRRGLAERDRRWQDVEERVSELERQQSSSQVRRDPSVR
jgi:hypothetical protein